MDYCIDSLWNGEPLDHDHMRLRVESSLDNYVQVIVGGQFFNDPAAPSSPAGSTDMLWDYEVVEAFFLNSNDTTYLEVEFGPHGHYIVLLLQGVKNAIKTLLPIEYSAVISEDRKTWEGIAYIPVDYFPPNVDKINAFAIHGSDPNRHYEQAYPQKPPLTHPDFHRLGDFNSVDFNSIISDNEGRGYSAVWRENMTPQ